MLRAFALSGLFLSQALTISCQNPSETPLSVNTGPYQRQEQSRIGINQWGYYPNSKKTIIVYNDQNYSVPMPYHIINMESGAVEMYGSLTVTAPWDGTPTRIIQGDFSNIQTPGHYKVVVPSIQESVSFQINNSIYDRPFHDALKTYYFQRASTAIPPQFGGRFARAAGHEDQNVWYHDGLGKTGSRSSAGGWYDAGDYGKYVVNGGVTIATLLHLYERFPNLVNDQTNIPESSNGQSDLLDEVIYEIQWMETMQDEDGGVFHKLSGLTWPGAVMPNQDQQQRYIIGKTTNASLNFAAVLAQAARVFRTKGQQQRSERWIQMADRAFTWARQHPHALVPQVDGSGPYEDGQFEDEFFWAAAELYAATSWDKYRGLLLGHENTTAELNLGQYTYQPRINGPVDWGQALGSPTGTLNLGYYTLANRGYSLGSERIGPIRAEILRYADSIANYAATNPARSPMKRWDFFWGSNSVHLNYGMHVAFAYSIDPKPLYLQTLSGIADYVLGHNYNSMSFITGYGERSPQNPHHRPSEADQVRAPIPGFVVGGPNADSYTAHNSVDRIRDSYIDIYDSYSTNETAINWSAPLVYVFGLLHHEAPKFRE